VPARQLAPAAARGVDHPGHASLGELVHILAQAGRILRLADLDALFDLALGAEARLAKRKQVRVDPLLAVVLSRVGLKLVTGHARRGVQDARHQCLEHPFAKRGRI